MERDRATRRGEHDVLAGPGRAAEPDRDRVAGGVLHLGSDGAHPDQLVEPELVAGQTGLGGGAERVTRRPDPLVGLLGVLDLRGVDAGAVGEVLGAVQLTHLVPGRPDGRVAQRRGVGPHIGDEAVLVEPLRNRHRRGGGEAQLSTGLLLERGRPERGVRRPAVGLRLDRPHLVRRVAQRSGQRLGVRLVEMHDLTPGGRACPPGGRACRDLELAVLAEVGTAGYPGAVDGVQPGREHPLLVLRAGIEGALEVPVGSEPERHPFPLPVHDQPGRHGLHAPGREAAHHLAPQHRRDLVAVEAVEDAPGLLSLDEVHVELARVVGSSQDRGLRDLVEDHPLDRNLGLQLV